MKHNCVNNVQKSGLVVQLIHPSPTSPSVFHLSRLQGNANRWNLLTEPPPQCDLGRFVISLHLGKNPSLVLTIINI